MKQRINGSDFALLSDKAKKKLRDWVFEKNAQEAKELYPNDYISINPPKRIDLFLNIGQLIEFLDEHKEFCELVRENNGGNSGFVWKLGCHYYEEWEEDFQSVELCDALFLAVKTILETEQ